MRFSSFVVPLLLGAEVANAAFGPFRKLIGVPRPRNNGLPNHIHLAHFDQLIDHSNPSLGTFKQRYWYNSQYWKGNGSPVILFTPGEEDAEGYIAYVTTFTLNGLVAQKIGGAMIVIEHRYWGTSSPYTVLSTANMTYLTLENAIADLNYFANTVKLPFASTGSNARDAPWVLIGGSYSGALTAWLFSVASGTFWAGLATSAPVQAISNFWTYFTPIQSGMPQNCSKDAGVVIEYLDNLMENGSPSDISAMKARFGLEKVSHNDDFMAALINGPAAWQSSYPARNAGFFTWCDYIENAVNTTQIPGGEGVGLEKALAGYAAWTKEVLVPGLCENHYGYYNGEMNTQCFDTYNPKNPMFTDLSLTNTVNRQWIWMLCNQPLGYWQGGPPAGKRPLASRLVTPKWFVRQCGLFFPTGPQGQTYGIAKGATEAQVNQYTGGWNPPPTTRLLFTNGQFDPWRSLSVSSIYRPGGPLQSTANVPVNLIAGGHHCWDLLTEDGYLDPAVLAVQKKEIAQLAQWVSEFPSGGYGLQ